MAYLETLSRLIVMIEADAAGAFLAGNVERRFAASHDGQPRSDVLVRDVITAADLPALLPQTALIAQVQALTDAVAAATEARDAAVADRNAATARVAELEALLAPVDASGFAVLSAVQVRLGLLAGGITPAQVEAIINAIPDETQRITAHTYWDYATALHRDHPLIVTLGAALGLTSAQVDAMWTAAAGM